MSDTPERMHVTVEMARLMEEKGLSDSLHEYISREWLEDQLNNFRSHASAADLQGNRDAKFITQGMVSAIESVLRWLGEE